MGYLDEEGNWIENFRSQPYETKEEAAYKIKEVVQFHTVENDWVLNGDPSIEQSGNKYVAVIPLKKPVQQNNKNR